jgi:hypothetical protein
VFGKPRLRAVWNYLDDLIKITGGGAEASWQRVNPGLHLKMDKDLHLTKKEMKVLEDLAEDYQHNVTRILPTRGVDINTLNAIVNAFGPNQDAVTRLICGVVGIPHRVLLGSERGEMASTQDRDNWSDRVAERRQEFGVPTVRALINRLQEFGALPQLSEADDYDVVWPDEEELNEQQKGALALTMAQANHANGDIILTSNEIRDQVWGLPPLAITAPNAASDPTLVDPSGNAQIDDPNAVPSTDNPSGDMPDQLPNTDPLQPNVIVGDFRATSSTPRNRTARGARGGNNIAKLRNAEIKRLVTTKLCIQRRLERERLGYASYAR